MSELLVLPVLAAGAFLGWRLRGRGRRRAQARELAASLLPEIRSILAACDSSRRDEETAPAAEVFASVRQKLPRALPADALYSVETFYGCVGAYSEAAKEMTAAFAPESEHSLGDRIRAKDRRDRCLKDVYYSGEAAIERLQKV